MSKNNIQKLFRLPEEVASLIPDLSKDLEMSESNFVAELIRNYAIDCKKIEGVKNYHLIEKMEIPTYEKSGEVKRTNEDISQLKRELYIIKNILNGLDEYGYITRDMLNALLLYLIDPQTDVKFKSTDTKLALVNKENAHTFLRQSLDNYAERIRREQINNSGR